MALVDEFAHTKMDNFFTEPGCDCRRVIISVLKPETGWSKSWATIGYGWESLDFYRKLSRNGRIQDKKVCFYGPAGVY